jgi:uncharacterized protein YcbX
VAERLSVWRYPVKSMLGSLRVTAPTERCRMTTLAQGDLPEDAKVLRRLAEDAEAQFGVYAEVVKPGRIAAGDAVVLD